MKNLYTWVAALLFVALTVSVTACTSASSAGTVTVVDRPDTHAVNANYMGYRAPLRPLNFIKLPVGSIRPEGWVRKFLELQRDGLTGHLGEISAWLEKDDNAWLTTGGDHGWEEVPYWLKGYSSLAYILNDPEMIEETKYWIEGVFASCQPDGYFGPVNERNGKRELWAQMIMLWCLQSYYEYSQDRRVIDLMTNYFKWQMTVPDDRLLEDFWENSRGGDNIISIYWLYSHTGDAFLLELAEKIHRNTADWTQSTSLPNWHNVNIAQCFREPATYYMQTGDSAMLKASYNVHRLIRRTFGQVPGGMFSNMLKQLKDAGKEDKLDEVLAEIPRVREDAGYPPLVTPTSQIVGTQAVFNVILGERYKMVTKEFKGLVHGDYGKTPAPISAEFTKKILGDEQPITCRFADTLAPEMDKLKAEAAKWAIQEEDVLTYAMFPQVAPKFFEKRNAKAQGVDADHADFANKSHPV